jgi:hypothetical protein
MAEFGAISTGTEYVPPSKTTFDPFATIPSRADTPDTSTKASNGTGQQSIGESKYSTADLPVALTGSFASPASTAPSDTATNAATTLPTEGISVDTATGQVPVNSWSGTSVNSTSTPSAGSTSISAATRAEQKKTLSDVDAVIAKYQGSAYKAPANQKARVEAVAAVADSLKGAEKTKFLSEIKTLGAPFALNFGQPSITDAGAVDKLDDQHKAVNAELNTEWRTGVAAAQTSSASKDAATPDASAKTAQPTTTTGDAAVTSAPTRSQEFRDYLNARKDLTTQEWKEEVDRWNLTTGSDRMTPSMVLEGLGPVISKEPEVVAHIKTGKTTSGEWAEFLSKTARS